MSRYLACIAVGGVAGIVILAAADFIVSQCFDARLFPTSDAPAYA